MIKKIAQTRPLSFNADAIGKRDQRSSETMASAIQQQVAGVLAGYGLSTTDQQQLMGALAPILAAVVPKGRTVEDVLDLANAAFFGMILGAVIWLYSMRQVYLRTPISKLAMLSLFLTLCRLCV